MHHRLWPDWIWKNIHDGGNLCLDVMYMDMKFQMEYKINYTQGSFHDPGINQRALQELFRKIDIAESDWSYTVTVSMLEIYNDCIHDLLSTSHQNKLEIKLSADGLYIPGLTQVSVSELDDVNMVSVNTAYTYLIIAGIIIVIASRDTAIIIVTKLNLQMF